MTPDFSIVVTCYYEEQSIEEFYERLSKAARSLDRPYEIVMVNDGSTDGTFGKLRGLFERDSRITAVIDLYRNAGQTAAMTAGLVNCRGKAIVFMDSDLQLDPEELPQLVRTFDEGYDIVSGARRERRDSFWRILPSKLANAVMRKVARHDLTDFGCTFKIYDAKLLRAFELGPFKPFRTAYVFSRAGRVKEVPVTHHERRYGRSGWTFRKLFAFYMDHFVGLSERPFQLLSAVSLGLAALFGLRLLLAWAVDFSILSDVTPGLLLNVLIVNLLVTLGLLSAVGEYVMRNFLVLQRFPVYVVREIHTRDAAAENPAGA